MHKGLIIYLSIFVGLVLFIGGSYFTIDNLIEPKGLLFEGIMSMGLGTILLMIITVATSVGNTFMMFGKILEQTAELNKQMAKVNRPSLPGLFSGMIPPGSSIQVTDLDSGETSSTNINPGNASDAVKMINDMIGKAMQGNPNIPNPQDSEPFNKDSSKEKLESELAKAIKKDDFETASKINAILKSRKDSGSKSQDDSENTSE